MSTRTMTIEEFRKRMAAAPELSAPVRLERAVTFFVPGKCEPAGSKNAFPLKNRHTGQWLRDAKGRPIVNVVDDNPKAKGWKTEIKAAARVAFHDAPTTDALRVTFVFTLSRPLGQLGTGRNQGVVKGSAPRHPLVKPDALKLARAAEDALTGVVYVDDAQIVQEHLWKRYGEIPGVEITIESLADDDRQGLLFPKGW